jgi:predicted methyltransferase
MKRMHTKAMTPTRRGAMLTLAALAAPAVRGQSDEDTALREAIAGAHRTPAFRARDAARHPYETLRFFGLRPDAKVLELAPGGGWYTEILAPYLRERGGLWLAGDARDSPIEYRRRGRAAIEAKLAKSPALYDRVQVGTLPAGNRFTDIAIPGGADLVLTFRNVHNWQEDGTLDGTLRACHALLKPGGVLGVVDHRAAPGTSVETMMKSGYVTEALMEDSARAAGFTLSARSEVNANPRDTKDHANGVWSLPPSFAGKDVDRERYAAIGESDRFTHRYVKPRG